MTRLLSVFTLFAAWISQAAYAGPLHDAAKSGDLATATQLLNQGAKVNEMDPFRGTPLHAAVAGRHADMVLLLITKGADVGAKELSLGLTPLHLAALADQVSIIVLLLDHRANIEARNNEGSTPLLVAAAHGRLHAVDTLIARGADVNTHNEIGDPPIHAAVAAGHAEVAALLRQKGAAPPILPPISPLLADADPERGRVSFYSTGLCNQCHSIERGGANKVGPNLWAVLGRDKAGVKSFVYTPSFSQFIGKWTYEEVNGLIASAHDFAPGTRMEARVTDLAERAALIRYLRENSDDPLPLPAK